MKLIKVRSTLTITSRESKKKGLYIYFWWLASKGDKHLLLSFSFFLRERASQKALVVEWSAIKKRAIKHNGLWVNLHVNMGGNNLIVG